MTREDGSSGGQPRRTGGKRTTGGQRASAPRPKSQGSSRDRAAQPRSSRASSGQPRPAQSRPAQSRPAQRRPAPARTVRVGVPGAATVGNPRNRQRIITLFSLVLLFVFAVRLVMIQGVNAAELSTAALENRLATTTDEPLRADIVDRNGVVLATSAERYHVFVNQVKLQEWSRQEGGQVVMQGPLDAAKVLAPILGVSESELAVDLVGDKSFQYIAKYITPEQWNLIDDEGIYGIDREPVTERFYPNGDIAGNIVGFVGGREDKQGVNWGLAGIEASYEDELLGTPGSLTYERGGGGTVIPTGVLEEEPAVPGSKVVLTIDRDIQYYAQERLAQALSESGSSAGIVMMQDVQTGEVLALADSGSVDPNDPGSTPASRRGSSAVEDVFEPGSTAKIITMAAALEEGLATPTSRYVAPYQYTTDNNQTFKDSHEHADEKLTLSGILVSSSNTGTIQVGEDLTEEQRYQYLSDFGFGQRTGVGLPTESAGILHPWQKWDGRTEWAVLYGQGVSVTALQTSQVYQTVANGGVRIAPSLVKGLQQPDGTLVESEAAEPVEVISEDTADQLMLMLEDVTESGTGGMAKIDGYRVAGKTGTAQAVGSDGQLSRIIASFVGVAPADDPRIVVSVILFDPKSSIWGGVVAAPVFSDVATFGLQALRVPPSGPAEEFYPTTWE
ncbi:penicillin-binding protein 2 [Demequina sp. NBRC 110056]|uniref:peptidoglycan D,D-transpeptidase FtsI family protein n=1 Tax=Demequina sp. NBRC 110056 TaxID=1570345 RepID=UPI000A02913B|nr:penicillin-binding protein 2 [Demequina sp. NBRC 110056]